MRLPAVLLPLLLLAPGCADREAEPAAADPVPVEDNVAAPAQAADLQGTIGALEGGVLEIPPASAAASVRAWRSALAPVPGTRDVRAGLAELSEALESPPLDGPRIGRILRELGAETTRLAGTATTQQAAVERLGALLTQAADQLDPRPAAP